MKSILPVLALVCLTPLITEAVACEQHSAQASMTTVEAAPAPQPAPAPTVIVQPAAAQPAQASEAKPQAAMSQPLGAAYENCNRMRQDKAVYLTQ